MSTTRVLTFVAGLVFGCLFGANLSSLNLSRLPPRQSEPLIPPRDSAELEEVRAMQAGVKRCE